jgi:hypothetical protein
VSIDVSKLSEEELRALKARIDRLPPPKPFVSGWKPHDYSHNVCAIDPRVPWVRDLVRANAAAGVDAAMAAEMADRRRPQPQPPSAGPRVERGNGWAPAVPIAPPEGINHVDRLCEAQDAIDRQKRIARMSPAERGAEIKRLRSEIDRATKEASHAD